MDAHLKDIKDREKVVDEQFDKYKKVRIWDCAVESQTFCYVLLRSRRRVFACGINLGSLLQRIFEDVLTGPSAWLLGRIHHGQTFEISPKPNTRQRNL